MDPAPSRRQFLTESASLAGVSWIALNAGALASLAACAREAAEQNAPLGALSEPESKTLAAFARQILPSGDGLPGADEAGAIHFIDQAVQGPFAGMRQLIADGARDLDERAARANPPAPSFADLTSDQQVEIMRDIEQDPFFFNARMLSIMGVLADPSYGGNRDGVGFALLGVQHVSAYQPPFGHYDAEAANGGAA